MKLYIFDLEGTLVKPFTEELLPGVLFWFQSVNWENTKCAIATDQGGVGLRYGMEQGKFGEPSKYPTIAEFQARVASIVSELVGNRIERLPVYASFCYLSKSGWWSPTPFDYLDEDAKPGEWKQAWRKPSPGMLWQAMEDAGVDRHSTIMVGDRDVDRLAASNAYIGYADRDQFFNLERF